MKHIFYILLFSLFLMLTVSCEKHCLFCDTKFEGVVYDSLSGKVIPEAKVSLYEYTICFSGGKTSDCWGYVDDDICNEKGEYKIKVNISSDSMKLIASKENEFFKQEIPVVSEEKQIVNFNLDPMAILRIHVNVNLDTSIRDYVLVYPGKSPTVIQYSRMSFDGSVDTFYDAQLYPNSLQEISWTIGKVDSYDYNLFFKDSIFCPPYQTTHYYINY